MGGNSVEIRGSVAIDNIIASAVSEEGCSFSRLKCQGICANQASPLVIGSDIVVRSFSEAKVNRFGIADARNFVFGVSGNSVTIKNGLRATAVASSTAPFHACSSCAAFGLAVGVRSQKEIVIGNPPETGARGIVMDLTEPRTIASYGTTYAFALSTGIDPDNPFHITSIHSPFALVAQSAARLAGEVNERTNRPTPRELTNGMKEMIMEARPVAEAEYVGLSANCSVVFALPSSLRFDNSGAPTRLFGARDVTFSSGTVVFNDGSWIVNSKDYRIPRVVWNVPDDSEYGELLPNAQPRATQLTIRRQARVLLNGMVKSVLAATDGAHAAGLFTTDGEIRLGRDYTLAMSVEESAVFGSSATASSMSFTDFAMAPQSVMEFALGSAGGADPCLVVHAENWSVKSGNHLNCRIRIANPKAGTFTLLKTNGDALAGIDFSSIGYELGDAAVDYAVSFTGDANTLNVTIQN